MCIYLYDRYNLAHIILILLYVMIYLHCLKLCNVIDVTLVEDSNLQFSANFAAGHKEKLGQLDTSAGIYTHLKKEYM